MLQHTILKYKQLLNHCIFCKLIKINSIINYHINYNTLNKNFEH